MKSSKVEKRGLRGSPSNRKPLTIKNNFLPNKSNSYYCLWCGKKIENWFELEGNLTGCRYYCSRKCCLEHWIATGGRIEDAPKCPCF